MRAREDLTNVQFPILNSHPKGEAAIRHPLRMRIEHWELSIGPIACPRSTAVHCNQEKVFIREGSPMRNMTDGSGNGTDQLVYRKITSRGYCNPKYWKRLRTHRSVSHDAKFMAFRSLRYFFGRRAGAP